MPKRTLRFGLIGILMATGSEGWAWQSNLGGNASRDNAAQALAVDSSNNVLAAGYFTNLRRGRDFTVVKLTPSGNQLWTYSLNGPANGRDVAGAVAVDSNNDVLAAGFITNSDSGTPAHRDFEVAKVNGTTGEELWHQELQSENGQALAVAVDTINDVWAAGFITLTDEFGDSHRQFEVARLSGSSGFVEGALGVRGNVGNNIANALVLDSNNNAVLAGFLTFSPTSANFTVCKITEFGQPVWDECAKINGTATGVDQALAVALDTNNDVLAVGFTTNRNTSRDFTVVKVNGSNGNVLWRHIIDGTARGNDQALAVAVDSSNDVLAVGFTTNLGTLSDFTVVKLSGVNGRLLWERVVDGSANSFDQARAVAVDANNDVVVAGSLGNIGTLDDFTVVKFSGVSGAELWRQSIDGAVSGDDRADAIAIDHNNDVVVAGFTINRPGFSDFTVVKLQGINGSDFPR